MIRLRLNDSTSETCRRGTSSLFFNDTATTEISTLSLHDALPICQHGGLGGFQHAIKTAQNCEGQNDFAVFGLLVIPAQEIGYGPNKRGKIGVAHVCLGKSVFRKQRWHPERYSEIWQRNKQKLSAGVQKEISARVQKETVLQGVVSEDFRPDVEWIT